MSLRISGIGTLTRDAEIRSTAKGAWMSFGLATKRRGVQEGKQDVDFFEASYFLKNPDSPLVNYMKKGTSIFLENAEMRVDQYEKDGENKIFTKVMIFTFDLLNTKKEDSDKKSPGTLDKKEDSKPAPKKAEPKEPPIVPPTDVDEPAYEDEVPF